MRIAKPLIVTALVAGNLLASSLVLCAQNATNSPPPPPPAGGPPPGGPPGGPGMRGRPNFDQMAKQLGLTEEQTPKFRSIMEDQMQKMRDLRQDPSLANMSPDERRAKVKAIQDDTTAQMKALLTPEQFDKWQKMPNMRGRRMGPPPGGPPPGSPNAGSTNAPPPPPKPPQQ